MTFTQIKNHIFFFKDSSYFDVVISAIELPSKLVMIDSGYNLPKVREFRAFVEKQIKKKFELLLITHHHSDHTWGNQIFNDCKIIAAPQVLARMKQEKKNLTKERIKQYQSRMENFEKIEGLKITPPTDTIDFLEIKDGDVKLIFKQTGGHTIDSSYIFCPKYKVLFTGDNLFENLFSYGQDQTSNPEI